MSTSKQKQDMDMKRDLATYKHTTIFTSSLYYAMNSLNFQFMHDLCAERHSKICYDRLEWNHVFVSGKDVKATRYDIVFYREHYRNMKLNIAV